MPKPRRPPDARAPSPPNLWSFLWTLGLVLGIVGIPALLGFMAGARIEESGAVTFPWRLLFVALGVGGGGLVAWRVIARRTV